MKNTSKEAYFERLRNLAEVKKPSLIESKNRTLGTLIDYKTAADGVVYGIIKENHNYYIKKGGTKKDPNVSDFAYIGGLGNITNFQYKSLSEADKNRNMLMHTISEATSLKPNINGSRKFLSEDKAGMEIDNAMGKLDDLDAATAAEKTQDDSGATDMAAGLDAEPQGGEGIPPAEGGEEMPPQEGGDNIPPAEGDNEMPSPEGGEEENVDDMPPAEGDDEMGVDGPIKELEKSIGKLTNTIRKTELEPTQVKAFVNSYLSAFKDKFPELEIEDRKDMANKILKVVPPEDVDSLADNISQGEEGGIEEETCSECGNFAKYAESKGYDSAESLMECGEEEVTNLISGYANAHNDGMNDGDHEGVATVVKAINPAMIDSLRGDYGHDDYAEKLTPYMDSMNESTDEENVQKLQELFGGIGRLFQRGGEKVAQGYDAAANKVSSVANNVANKVGNAATAISQTYHSGEVAGEIKKIEALANNLGSQVAALNTRLKKAGQPEIETNKLIAGITNQIRGGKSANVGGTSAGAAIQREGIDPANVETQPVNEVDSEEAIDSKEDVGFAPAAQTLGAGVNKPDGAPTTISLQSKNGTSVDVSLNEVMKKLREVVAEGKKPSADLSKEEKSKVVKKAKAGEDIGKKGKGFEKVEDKATKEYGSKETGKKVAAAAMWKNLKEEDENNTEIMTESEIKLRDYVRKRLEEQSGMRKPSLNEGEKSNTLKKLDELIDKRFKEYRSTVK